MKRIQESDAERLVEALDREIRRRGRGAIAAVNRGTGHAEGWWQHRAESGDITAGQMLQVLDHLGLDPVKFVRRALGAAGGLELDRPAGDPPEIVERARERLRSGVEGSIGSGFLETLDHQRYREPAKALDLALWAVDHVELALLPRLLGVAGSTFRLSIRLTEAEHAIHAGIEMAESVRDRSTVGALAQRLAYVVADRGDRAEALRLSERAALIFLRAADTAAVGTALVDQGIWLYYLHRFDESIEAHRSALDLLPADAGRNRFAAFQFLGLNYRELKELEEAMRWCVVAEDSARATGVEEWANNRLMWLQARICSDLGELDQAAKLFADVVESFREVHPGEAALATCELVRVRLRQGQHEAAYRAAASMRTLLEPLRDNPILSAAIGDLLRFGRVGLTLALAERIQARIEDECERRQVLKMYWLF